MAIRSNQPKLRSLMLAVAMCVVSMGAWGCSSEPAKDEATPADSAGTAASGGAAATPAAGSDAAASATPSPSDGARITGIAFVDSSVTGQGSRAKLPAGAKVHLIGSKITGTEGCPTNRYRTDGLIVAVIDYEGRPTSGALTIVENREGGGRISRAPYYLNLDPGRKLQFLGPTFDNGTYDLELVYDYSRGDKKSVTGQFVLARQCPKVN